MSFIDFPMCDALARAVQELGYSEPTPIQVRAIPAVLEGRDLLAAAQTGTGKTAAFGLPLLERLHREGAPALGRRAPRALILVPTRELAAQVAASIRDLGRHLSLESMVIFGGVSAKPQAEQLRRGVDVVIATPGRLLDHANSRAIDLSRISMLVLDEADRMLDMGFIRDIRRVLAMLPPVRQNLLFSATFSDEIRRLASGLLRDPLSIDVAPRNATAAKVSHSVYHVDGARKRAVLSHLLTAERSEQTLVFTRTKHGANRLAAQLEKDGFQVAAIHGNKSQNARTRALEDFKENRIAVLVATDIAARGIDITELPFVVNYELPHVPEDYVHRIGRTGRAGADGHAISLVSSDERDRLRAIERVLGRQIEVKQTPAVAASADHDVPRSDSRPRSNHSGQRTYGQGGRPNNGGGGQARSSGGPGRPGGQGRPATQGRPSGQGRPAGQGRPSAQGRAAGPGRPAGGAVREAASHHGHSGRSRSGRGH